MFELSDQGHDFDDFHTLRLAVCALPVDFDWSTPVEIRIKVRSELGQHLKAVFGAYGALNHPEDLHQMNVATLTKVFLCDGEGDAKRMRVSESGTSTSPVSTQDSTTNTSPPASPPSPSVAVAVNFVNECPISEAAWRAMFRTQDQSLRNAKLREDDLTARLRTCEEKTPTNEAVQALQDKLTDYTKMMESMTPLGFEAKMLAPTVVELTRDEYGALNDQPSYQRRMFAAHLSRIRPHPLRLQTAHRLIRITGAPATEGRTDPPAGIPFGLRAVYDISNFVFPCVGKQLMAYYEALSDEGRKLFYESQEELDRALADQNRKWAATGIAPIPFSL